VPEVGQRTLDAVVAPGRTLAGHAQDQVNDLRPDSWPPHGLAAIAEDFALGRQASALLVAVPDSSLAVGFLQHLILGEEMLACSGHSDAR